MNGVLSEIMCSVAYNLMPNAFGMGSFGLGGLINGVAYIGGAMAVGSGLYLLVKWADQRDTPLSQPIARMVAGACLLSFPSFINALLNTLFLQNGPSGIASVSAGVCSAAEGAVVPASSSSVPLDTLLTNLMGNIKDPMTVLLSLIAMLVGAIYIFRGLVKASRYGTDPRAYSVTAILSNLIVGAILITVGTSLTAIINTLFGFGGGGSVNVNNILASSTFWDSFNSGTFVTNAGFSADQLSEFETAVSAALTFFQIIGFISFIRGWMILKSYADQTGNGTAAQGLTHVFGGAMAVNIYQVLMILDTTFGTGFLS